MLLNTTFKVTMLIDELLIVTTLIFANIKVRDVNHKYDRSILDASTC